MRAMAWAGAGLFAVALGGFAWAFLGAWGMPAPAEPRFPWDRVVVNVAAFTVFAAHHSVLARPSAKRWLTRVVPPAMERSLYVWVASVLFLALCVLWQPLPGVAWQAEGLARLALYGVQVAGLGLTLTSARRLDIWDLAGVGQVSRTAAPPGARSSASAGDTHQQGAGTLEASGPYRWVRHPIYLGWVLLVFGAPTMTTTRLLWAAVSAAYLVVAIPLEERGLTGTFGPAYRTYQRQVRWRLLPGVW